MARTPVRREYFEERTSVSSLVTRNMPLYDDFVAKTYKNVPQRVNIYFLVCGTYNEKRITIKTIHDHVHCLTHPRVRSYILPVNDYCHYNVHFCTCSTCRALRHRALFPVCQVRWVSLSSDYTHTLQQESIDLRRDWNHSIWECCLPPRAIDISECRLQTKKSGKNMKIQHIPTAGFNVPCTITPFWWLLSTATDSAIYSAHSNLAVAVKLFKGVSSFPSKSVLRVTPLVYTGKLIQQIHVETSLCTNNERGSMQRRIE